MVIVSSVLDDGRDITIACEVWGNPTAPFPAAGELLGRLAVSVQVGTPVGIIAGIVRQEAAQIWENAIRGADLKRNLSVMDLEK